MGGRQYPERVTRCELYHAAGMGCDEGRHPVSEAVERVFMVNSIFDLCAQIGKHAIFAAAERLEHYAWRLAGAVDLVVITQPAVLLAVVLATPSLRSKSILVYLSTLPFYQVDDGDRPWFRHLFASAAKEPQVAFTTNDSWLQLHVKRVARAVMTTVRGLALYTGVKPVEHASRGLLICHRPRDEALPCLLQRLVTSMHAEKRPYEIVFGANSLSGYWNDMANFMAVALFPKAFYSMLFEEIYAMAVPIFVPQHLSMHIRMVDGSLCKITAEVFTCCL